LSAKSAGTRDYSRRLTPVKPFSVLNITNRDALQEFLGGHNQIGSPNFAYGPDGTFRGQNRQAARMAQLSLLFEF
jgi:hypothetical protein